MRETTRINARENWNVYSDKCYACQKNPNAYLERMLELAGINLENSSAQKNEITGKRGGARNVIWNPGRRTEFLTLYEKCLQEIKNKDSNLPEHVKKQLQLRGVKPSDIARDYAAEIYGVESNEYLPRVLTQARRERR